MRAEIRHAPGGTMGAERGPDAFGHHDYRITSAAARLALLTDLRDRSTPVLMHAPDGHALRTTLWVVDAAASRLAFALSPAELAAPYLSPLLDAEEVTAIAHPGHVKLQFELCGLVLVRGHASAVLQSAMPDEVLRIQRRETFRVCPPVASPVAYLRHPAIPDMSLALRVLDLSLGGCALRMPDDVPALEPGTRISGVAIELDLNTRLRVDLMLQHITHLGPPGPPGRGGGARLGCEWQMLRPEDERTLQRWVDQAQARQRMGQRHGPNNGPNNGRQRARQRVNQRLAQRARQRVQRWAEQRAEHGPGGPPAPGAGARRALVTVGAMQRRGFTLVEVLVAGVVGVLLATMAWPTYRGQLQRAARSEAIEALQKLQLAQERHREMFGVYATELRTLAIAPATPGGRYELALAAFGVEAYQARASATAGGPQQGDTPCTAITIDVRQGFATLGPEGKCWNR